MSDIKKSSFFRNRSFSAKSRFKMQSYLNKMSANGMHISKIGRSKCFFDEDASVRYLYSICGDEEDGLYTEGSGWVHFCNYKGVPFYKRAVPTDAVKLVRDYSKKHLKQERSWLNARLREGLSLIGRVGNEYIFQRTKEYTEYEYVIKQVGKSKKTKDGELLSPLGNTSGLLFLTTNDDGSLYYFIKDEAARHNVTQTRGKRLSDQIFSIFAATGAAIGFCAAAVVAVYGLIKGGSLLIPLLICGSVGALIFAIAFGVYFRRFQRIAEERRIRKEEKRLREEAEALSKDAIAPDAEQKPIETPNNNTVVMNTVVMNNYGDAKNQGSMQNMGINSLGQLYDDTLIEQNPALDPRVNPAIAAARDPQGFARSVMHSAQYGDAADTLVQGETHNDIAPNQLIEPRRAAALPASTTFDDEDWVGTESEADGENEDYEDEADFDTFPLGSFIFGAIACFAAVMAFIFGLRYGITYFVNFGKENVLSLLFSVLGVAFAPFALHYGITTCRDILRENAYEPDDEYGE